MNPISESDQVPKLDQVWLTRIIQVGLVGLVMCTPPLKTVPPEDAPDPPQTSPPHLHEAAEITATVLVHE